MRPLFEWGIWGEMWVSVLVLVAINQPFTIWMMRSFFMNVPRELDESAMIDGCNRFQGFWHVIMPVMWPGVITTGLFSFLLAYNDFTVTSALLSQENTTMIPRIASFWFSAIGRRSNGCGCSRCDCYGAAVRFNYGFPASACEWSHRWCSKRLKK